MEFGFEALLYVYSTLIWSAELTVDISPRGYRVDCPAHDIPAVLDSGVRESIGTARDARR